MLDYGVTFSEGQREPLCRGPVLNGTIGQIANEDEFPTLTDVVLPSAVTAELTTLTATADELPALSKNETDSSSSPNVVGVAIETASPGDSFTSAGKVVQRVMTNTYDLAKVSVDFLLSVISAILAVPVVLVAALAVKLTSRGPALYSQIRLGRGGRPYAIYKIRTMTHNCETQSGACWSTAGDSRVTAVGRFLRRTHIDELPQLWNVLRGDMSLVGPRPERPEFVPKLAQAIPGYRERLLARPGVTGLAQVQLPADTDLDSVRRKLAFDLYYIENASLLLDLRLILCTAFNTAGVPFWLTGKLFWIPSGEEIERAYETAVAVRGVGPELQPA
jgi:lipopolysaccharide/colanic/teichoic acid biosynthesis glycosyltransferase